MEAVDEEGEQNSEEELLSKNGEATSANEDDSIASKIPTPQQPTPTNDGVLAMNIKEMKAELKKKT